MRRARALFFEPQPLRSVSASRHYAWLVVGSVCIGAFLGQLDASIAGLVLPTLEAVFHAPVAAVEWVALVYLLVLAVLVVPLGRLADIAGRKTLYTSGFLVFVLGSALCGLAPNIELLLACRALQAVGAAMLQANSVAIITAAVPRRMLGRAIGIQGAAQAVGLSIGPAVGGALIDAFGWRWVFLIAVPFGLAGTVLGWLMLPASERAAPELAEQRRFDWAGAALLGACVALLLLGLSFASEWGWTSPGTVAIGIAVIACMAAFVAVEKRSVAPMVDFAVLGNPSIAFGLLAGMLSYAVLFGSLFLLPFLLQRVHGTSAAQAGVLETPIPIALAVIAPIAGVLADRFGPRPPTVFGMAVAAVALLALAALGSDSANVVLVPLAMLGIGIGLFTPSNNSAVMASAPRERLGVAGGLLNMTRSLGTSLGVAATGAVLTMRLSASGGQQLARTLDAPPAVLAPAFGDALVFLGAVSIVAAAVSAIRGARAEVQIPSRALPRLRPWLPRVAVLVLVTAALGLGVLSGFGFAAGQAATPAEGSRPTGARAAAAYVLVTQEWQMATPPQSQP